MTRTFVGLFLCALVLLSGCQTGGVLLRETPLSLSETRRVITIVIGEPRDLSQNGREIYSKYYDRRNNRLEKMDMVRERYYTLVTVLGDRRPYDVQVQVLVERRTPEGGWEQVERDDDRAAVLAEKIRVTLNQSRDNRNVIDDFRSF
ncbi:MAG: hypothetical protein HUU57_01000 [Bdellovibrio sp.]|nr:hypothetical protein [Bdellovibrio sp.]